MAGVKDIPIRVLIGYLSESSQRDAETYALGIAEKHNESGEISFFGVFPYDKGFIYEVQEGGLGKSFVPSIIKYFKTNAAKHTKDEPLFAVIPASIRKLYIEKGDEGVQSMLLPENTELRVSEWLKLGDSLKPAVPKRTGILIAGIIIFVLGLLTLWASYFSRYQPYTAAPAPTPEKISYSEYPVAQWDKLRSAAATGGYVGALEYADGKWNIKSAKSAAAPAGSSAALPSAPVPTGGNPAPTPVTGQPLPPAQPKP